MTRSTHRHTRASKKKTHHYRPKRINISEFRNKPSEVPPRVIYVSSPFYEQLASGEKTVEARPNYPSLQDIQPGTTVEFHKNQYSDSSITVRITSRRVHRDFVTMLRKETIQDCLPDHDPEDLQRAVNTYHSFRQETYKFIAKKHGVVSFRFTNLDQQDTFSQQTHHHTADRLLVEYDRNSLCSIFEAVDKYRKIRKFGRL